MFREFVISSFYWPSTTESFFVSNTRSSDFHFFSWIIVVLQIEWGNRRRCSVSPWKVYYRVVPTRMVPNKFRLSSCIFGSINFFCVRFSFRTDGRVSENVYSFIADMTDNKARFTCEASSVINRTRLTTEVNLTVHCKCQSVLHTLTYVYVVYYTRVRTSTFVLRTTFSNYEY